MITKSIQLISTVYALQLIGITQQSEVRTVAIYGQTYHGRDRRTLASNKQLHELIFSACII